MYLIFPLEAMLVALAIVTTMQCYDSYNANSCRYVGLTVKFRSFNSKMLEEA